MSPTRLLVSVSLSCLLAACAARPPPALCVKEAKLDDRLIPTPDDWFALLLHGFDRQQGLAPRPTLDCSGSPVVWHEPQAGECREPGPEPLALQPQARLTDEDLVLQTVDANLRLVWVITRRFSNGEGLGPIGLVERNEGGFVVRALGSLRAYPRQAQLRLERAGDVTVLFAEGEACTGQIDPVCRRMVRVLPLRQGRFFAEGVVSSAGTCLGPTWFPLSREQKLSLPNGLQRKVEFTSALSVKAEGILVDEQVAIYELDPQQPSLPTRLYRKSQAQRLLKVQQSRLEGSEPSLWIRMLEPELNEGATPVEAFEEERGPRLLQADEKL